jgi:hypothetical protein
MFGKCPARAPGTIRTRNLMGRNHLLYPVELQGRGTAARREPARSGLCHTRGSLVAVAQLEERRDVAPEVAGSSPVGHPPVTNAADRGDDVIAVDRSMRL